MSGSRAHRPPSPGISASPSDPVVAALTAIFQALCLNNGDRPESQHPPVQTANNPLSQPGEAEIVLGLHYMLGGHWWDIDLNKLFPSGDNKPEVFQSSGESQNKTTEPEMDGVGENGDESEADEDLNSNGKHSPSQRNKKSKPKSKKSKKKSKRGHGKRHKTEMEGDAHSNPAWHTETGESSSRCSKNNDTAALTSTGVCDVVKTTEVARPTEVTDNWTSFNGYSFWRQFSGYPRARGLDDEFQACTKCGGEASVSAMVTCKRCELARYCSTGCKQKDARRHKPTCLRLFRFHTARRSAQVILDTCQKMYTNAIVRPPLSYCLGSIPDRTRYMNLPNFHSPVLLEMLESKHTIDLREWILKVRDVTNKTATVLLRRSAREFTDQDNLILLQHFMPGDFILIVNAFWSVGASVEQHRIILELKGQYFIVKGVV